MTMLNARDISELNKVSSHKLMSWIEQRGLDIHRG